MDIDSSADETTTTPSLSPHGPRRSLSPSKRRDRSAQYMPDAKKQKAELDTTSAPSDLAALPLGTESSSDISMDSGDAFMAHRSPPDRELSESPLNLMNLDKTDFSSSDESGGRLSTISEISEEFNHTRRQLSNLSLNLEISNAWPSDVGSPSTKSDKVRKQVENENAVENEVEKEIQEALRLEIQRQGVIDKMRVDIGRLRIAINQNTLQAELLDREWELAMLETRRKYIVQVGKDGHDEILSTSATRAKYKVLAKEILRRCNPDNAALQKVYNKVPVQEVDPILQRLQDSALESSFWLLMAPLRSDRAETFRCVALHPFYTWTAVEARRTQLKQELINFFNARFTFQVSILMKVEVRLDGPLLYLGGDSAFSESEGLITGGDDLEKLWHINTNIWTSLVDQGKKTGRIRPKSDAMNINRDAPGGDQRQTQRSKSDAMTICEDAPKPELRGQSTNLSKTSERTRRETGTKDVEIGFFVADSTRAAQDFDRAEASTRRGMTESETLYCDAKRALPEEFEIALENKLMNVKNEVNEMISEVILESKSETGEDYMDQQSVIEEDESDSVQKIAAAPIHTEIKLKIKNGDGAFSEIDAIEHVRPRDISDATTIEIRRCDTPMENIYDE